MTVQRAYILKTVMWNMQLDIDVDPTKSLGEWHWLLKPEISFFFS